MSKAAILAEVFNRRPFAVFLNWLSTLPNLAATFHLKLYEVTQGDLSKVRSSPEVTSLLRQHWVGRSNILDPLLPASGDIILIALAQLTGRPLPKPVSMTLIRHGMPSSNLLVWRFYNSPRPLMGVGSLRRGCLLTVLPFLAGSVL